MPTDAEAARLAALPMPLVPAHVDLRDFSYMPLDVLRLRDSDLAAGSAAIFHASVLLWCASWHQLPAGSLPDHGPTLARYAHHTRRWAAISGPVMRQWILCSDGRLYHPVVAEKVLEAQAAKEAQRAKTRAATEARAARRRADEAAHMAQLEAALMAQRGDADRLRDVRNIPTKGREEKVREGIVEKEKGQLSLASARPPDEAASGTGTLAGIQPPPPPPPAAPPDCPQKAILALWAEVLPALPQHLPEQWRGAREHNLRARWRETAVAKGWPDSAAGLLYLRKLFTYVGQSAFLTGRTRQRDGARPPFVVELEWLVNPTNWAKVHEGKYHQDAA